MNAKNLKDSGQWKVALKRLIRNQITLKNALRNFKSLFPEDMSEWFQLYKPYHIRHKPLCPAYCLEALEVQSELCENGFPVPPQSYWLGYGETPAEYLESGKKDAAFLKQSLAECGMDLGTEHLLDLGCGSARILRWLETKGINEIWGADINASLIFWCQEHLPPPFYFIPVTTAPSLPFKDAYFGLVTGFSVFTHIDDLAFSWFQELRRVLRSQGLLYITIHDESSIDAFNSDERPFVRELKNDSNFKEYSKKNYNMFTVYRGRDSQVFYKRDYLVKKLSAWFELVAAKPVGHGYQTVMIFRKIA